MKQQHLIQTETATIRSILPEYSDGPLVIHRETLLSELPSLSGHQYVLVQGDGFRIIGLVAVDDIRRRLNSPNSFERNRWRSMPLGAMLNVPLTEEQPSGPQFVEGEVSCKAICEQGRLFGLAVDGDLFLSWRRLESLFVAALSDPLTGLMNRLAYERRLREEWERASRTGGSIAVVVVDLDDFKGINDTYGHAVGDEILSRVARQLEMSMRSYDVVARFGGDEFVALCLGCGPGDIRIPLRRVLDSLAEICVQHSGDSIGISASIGAAVRHCDFGSHQPEDLFVAADKCLYEAKQSASSSWKIEFGHEAEPVPEPVTFRDGAHTNSSRVTEI
ncbi:MAG: GGDEF domain-containing protein [Planctomycetaceae bacterium]